MKKINVIRFLLVVAGLIGIIVGGAQLFIPVSFEATAEIELGNNSSLLSEIRAAGGTLLMAGIVMLSGAFYVRFTYFATIVSVLFYFSYGFSRLFSMLADGLPSQPLIIATITELIIGALSLIAVYTLRKSIPAKIVA